MADRIPNALRRVADSLTPFINGESDLMDVQETALALEELERVGVSSMTVAKLRRELEKRGLRKLPKGDKSHE